jgi:hypothetical protein
LCSQISLNPSLGTPIGCTFRKLTPVEVSCSLGSLFLNYGAMSKKLEEFGSSKGKSKKLGKEINVIPALKASPKTVFLLLMGNSKKLFVKVYETEVT